MKITLILACKITDPIRIQALSTVGTADQQRSCIWSIRYCLFTFFSNGKANLSFFIPGVSFILILDAKNDYAPRPYEAWQINPLIKRTPKVNPC